MEFGAPVRFMAATLPFYIDQHQVASSRQRYTVLTLACFPLTQAGFLNGFSFRLGGVSRLPKQALNLSDKNDSTKNIQENMNRFLDSLGVRGHSVWMADQIHSDLRYQVNSKAKPGQQKPQADAFLTQKKKILIGVKTADCVPLLLADPRSGWMAAVHAGWRGTLDSITTKTLKDIQKKGGHPRDLIVAIGPAACGDCYEIGLNVAELFQQRFPGYRKFLKKKSASKWMLNTAEANRRQLIELGVLEKNIHTAPFCTMHHNNLLFSHRKESQNNKKPVGRQLAVIGRFE